MKPLSFIALFFYLSSLFPSVQSLAADQWLASPQSSPTHSVAQLTSVTSSPVKHLMLSDDDDQGLAQLYSHVIGPALSQSYSVLTTAYYPQRAVAFLARAPPVVLNKLTIFAR